LEHLSFINDSKDDGSSEEHGEEGVVYSADEPDDVKPSSLGVKGFVPNLDKINLVGAEKYRKDQAESMQRLYILYRIPRLKSINRKLVSDEEYRLASPTTGKKLPHLSQRLFDLRADSKLIIFDADGNNSDCKQSAIGVEMTLNQHFCSDSPLVKQKKSPESVTVTLHVDEEPPVKTVMNESVTDDEKRHHWMMQDRSHHVSIQDKSNHASNIFSVSHIDSFEENDGKGKEVLNDEQREEVQHETDTSNLDLYVKSTSNKSVKNSSPSSIQSSKSNLSSASILIANMKPFEGKDETSENHVQSSSEKNETSNAPNEITSTTGDMKKKLNLNKTRSSRPPPSPESVLQQQGSKRNVPLLTQRKNNTRPSSIVPLASLFDEESSDEEEE
jgi:hypothetical protein